MSDPLLWISNFTFNEVYQTILQNVRLHKKTLLFPINVHSLRLIAKGDNAAIFRKADILFPDGILILWLCALIGKKTNGRVSGTDLVGKLLDTKDLRIYIFGSTPNTVNTISSLYSGPDHASVVGGLSPARNALNDTKTFRLLKENVRRLKPHILLVALGQPKQEEWLAKYFSGLNIHIGISVGSALDILSGAKPRAPFFIRNYGLEWAWRVIQEPKRLGVRYLEDGIFMIKRLCLMYH